MPMPELIKEISLGPHKLRLFIQDEKSYVEREEQPIYHVWLLGQQLPIICDPAHIKVFAEISNFLWKGLQFQYIENITSYQSFYREQIELERKCPSDIFQYRLTDYKIFDVTVMHEPRLEEGKLSYYVFNASNGLPYRVVCPFPYTAASTLVHYQILPIKEEVSLS